MLCEEVSLALAEAKGKVESVESVEAHRQLLEVTQLHAHFLVLTKVSYFEQHYVAALLSDLGEHCLSAALQRLLVLH